MDPSVDDLDNLGMMLGKKLGRLEMSSVDMLNKFADLGDKVGVVEEALLDEHAALCYLLANSLHELAPQPLGVKGIRLTGYRVNG